MRNGLIMVMCFAGLSALAAEGPAAPKIIMPGGQFRRAIETAFTTTAPYYVLVHVVNGQTEETRTVCIEPSRLLHAIVLEHGFTQDKTGMAKAKELALNRADRTFHFSNQEAFQAASPRYTEEMLAEVRERVKEMKTEDVTGQIMNQLSPLYRFCGKKGERAIPCYLDAVAHILMERGLACGRSCRPGLIFVKKGKGEPAAPPGRKQPATPRPSGTDR